MSKKSRILIIFITGIIAVGVMLAITSCSNPPDILKNNDGEIVEEQACWHWRQCMYVTLKTKQPVTSCDKLYEYCSRSAIFEKCEKIKDPMEKNNCWIKLK